MLWILLESCNTLTVLTGNTFLIGKKQENKFGESTEK